ncbi:MAG: hypothetical protein PUB12_05425 [[Clostridium] aminophilum]|uniref:hypothetical protein n=1 Tax=[Clostridium] aminophilum TaxID=1526 RepID=UPI0026F2512D|nr:hypothetical protein [[Clostridium] aminophilum]MDD6196314.1 hypothetical protein [[Clostridium] aminophilum]
MPQINKIRIVNFNYNDGNRFIPDELYDLSSDKGEALNSLFNLNNGGGKTVLVQLMMQPVHPRAMAGGRRIEDYFGRPGDHSFVLVEWNLDGSDDKLLTGIAIAGSASENNDENSRGNIIRYYTFKTVYENSYSSYSISALELSKNENGKYVPAPFNYVRDKAKNSRGVLEVYSSDESTKWTKALSEYGIYRSEWETVIEALNKDEGGLNQYFDEAKTSDKLISKFFIPAIENKMKSVASSGTDSFLETMLINYAKRISEKEAVIRERDTNRRLIAELSDLGQRSDDLYTVGENLSDSIGEACGFKASVGRKIGNIDESLSGTVEELQRVEAKIRHIEHEEKSKEYYDAGGEHEAAVHALSDAKEALDQAREESRVKKHDEDILQSARLYRQIVEADSQITAYKKLIEEKENDSEDAETVGKLKYSCMVKAKHESEILSQSISGVDDQLQIKNDELRDSKAEMERAEVLLNDAKQNHAQITANLNASKDGTDTKVKTLRIEAVRMLDGFYSEKDIDDERSKQAEDREKAVVFIEKLQNEIKALDDRKNEIPGELADVKIEYDRLSVEKKAAEDALSEYRTLLDLLESVCSKYSLENSAVFSGRLKSVLLEETEMNGAKLRKLQQDKQSLKERLKAAKEGHVHILPDILKYVLSTGVYCQTGEEYITGLLENSAITQEKAGDIMERHPEFAFSLLFNNEKDMEKMLSAGNVEWLPASVPLFTMAQVNAFMSGDMDRTSFLAAFDRAYFADRSGYCERLENEIRSKEENLQRFSERLRDSEEEKRLAEQFDYPEDWSSLQEKVIAELQDNILALERRRKALKEEQGRIKERIDKLKDDLSREEKLFQELTMWFESFAELSIMIAKENEWYTKAQEAYVALKKAESSYKKTCETVIKCRDELTSLDNDRKQQADHLAKVRVVLENTSNVKETELAEGTLEELYSQYQTLLGSLSESLEILKISLDKAQQEKAEHEKELEDYECDQSEYETVHFSTEALKNAKDAVRFASEKMEKAQSIFGACNVKVASARQRFDAAGKALEDFDGIALPQSEIGEDFKNRVKAAKLEIKQLSERKESLEREKRSLERIYDRVGDVLKPIQFGNIIKTVTLSEQPDVQWESIHENLIHVQKTFMDQKEKLNSRIRTTVAEFKDIALSEIVNKLGAIGEMLDDSGMKGDRLYTVSESISTMTASIEKINSRIETDLREIENDFNDIVDQCMNQGKRMYLDLRMIAASSKAHIFEGTPQTQMVKMDLPEEKEISGEASRVSIKTEIEQGANEIKELLGGGADKKQIQKRARTIVSSERLLHKYIRQESIKIKVYKIDMNSANSVYKGWEETLTQSSGAEKFVVFFSVVLTLMNYTRSSAGLVSKNVKSVLILDNPFGKITSAHLLKPMFDIAKHFHVQLICLSDINKSDVVGCFDCVIKLVIKAQSLSNFEIMTHEGNERIEHGYYKIMNGQMSLFG